MIHLILLHNCCHRRYCPSSLGCTYRTLILCSDNIFACVLFCCEAMTSFSSNTIKNGNYDSKIASVTGNLVLQDILGNAGQGSEHVLHDFVQNKELQDSPSDRKSFNEVRRPAGMWNPGPRTTLAYRATPLKPHSGNSQIWRTCPPYSNIYQN